MKPYNTWSSNFKTVISYTSERDCFFFVCIKITKKNK